MRSGAPCSKPAARPPVEQFEEALGEVANSIAWLSDGLAVHSHLPGRLSIHHDGGIDPRSLAVACVDFELGPLDVAIREVLVQSLSTRGSKAMRF